MRPSRFATALALALVTFLLVTANNAFAATYLAWSQGFDSNADGWFDSSDAGWEDYGQLVRVPTGTDGITAASASWYAQVSGTPGPDGSGPFSRFDGYRSVWPGTWTASIDVYLDPAAWPNDSGFDYSVAANGTNGAHRRDFVFHVGKYAATGGNIFIGASNGSNFAPRTDLGSITHASISTAGWYTLQHTFSDVGGKLSVDLKVLNSANAVLMTQTLSDASDLIPSVVGGNRYSWFTFVKDVTVPVDNHSLNIADGWKVVRRSNIGVDWSKADTRAGGDDSFVYGAAPSGEGSLQMKTNSLPGTADDSIAKAQFFTTNYAGTALGSIDALSYFAYRSSSSTSPIAQNVAFNIELDYLGNGASFTTLVYESVYQPGGVGAMALDTWQRWDAYNGGAGIWWSTKDIPGVCAFSCYVDWNTIKAANSSAKIIRMGFNVGSGLDGLFLGNADALTIGVSSARTVYDFEPAATHQVVVTAFDLEPSTVLATAAANNNWLFYNDENDTIDNSLGNFVGGPGAPNGLGSVQVSVSGTQRRNLATYQFRGTKLSDIEVLAFSTYNPSAGNGGSANRTGYLNFNVDFNGSDTWQRRLVYLPSQNGTVVQNSWQEWDAINNGNALWSWSGFEANGNKWPDNDTNVYRTWSSILAAWPNARIRVTDSFLGIRVGEPYANGYTENIDSFKFAKNDVLTVFNFEPGALDIKDAAINMHGAQTFQVPVTLESGISSLSSASFAVAWNQACVAFDSVTDSNNDGIPDSVTNLPSSSLFNITVSRIGNERKVTILIQPKPAASLPVLTDGIVANLQFNATACDTTPGSTLPLPVIFTFPVSSSPAVIPSFGNNAGQSVDGLASGGTTTLTFNASPSDILLSANSLNENLAGGTTVGTLCTTDDTPDGTDCSSGPAIFTYSLASGGACTSDAGNFAFTLAGNQLKTAGAFNFETQSSYQVCVQSTDAYGLSLNKTFQVNVLNVNEAPTDIALSASTINENVASGTAVGTLSTADEDAGNTFTYAQCSSPAPLTQFAISGSTLQTNAVLNFETQSSYNVCVRSTDQNGLAVENTFTISVVDFNDNPVAVNDPASTPIVVVAGSSVVIDVLANDTDQDAGDVLSVNSVANGAHGTNSIAPDAFHVTYAAAAAAYNGTDSFTYKAKDNSSPAGVSGDATVALNVVANNARADCNADGQIDAADFPATVLEIFDNDDSVNWWRTFTGSFAGSPLGCDSNASKNGLSGTAASVDAGDIICTVLVFFGNSACTTPVAAAAATTEAATLSIPSDVAGATGSTVAVPVTLESAGNRVAAAAFALSFDGAAFDPADGNGDGIPDAITLNVPAGVAASVSYDADNNRILVAIYSTALPMPLLSDGALATINLQANGGTSALSLTQASLGSDAGQSIPVLVDGGTTPTQGQDSIFLPMLGQYP